MLLEIRNGKQLAENRESWRGVMEAAMELQSPESAKKNNMYKYLPNNNIFFYYSKFNTEFK